MKYSLTLVSVIGLNLGITLAQDAQMLAAVGFPACAVPCIQQGNKAATDKHGCAPMDGLCQCTTAYKTVQETTMGCVMTTKPCADADMAKLAQAGAQLCASVKGAPHPTGSSPPAAGAAAPPAGSPTPASTPTNAGSSAGHANSSTDSSHSGSGSVNGTATKPNTATTSAPGGAGGAHAASGPSSSAGAAHPEKTFAAGALGLVGAVIALAI